MITHLPPTSLVATTTQIQTLKDYNMEIIVSPSSLKGQISIPGSKSHTIRAAVIATLAEGVSKIYAPLVSDDTLSCIRGCQAFGALFQDYGEYWQIEGTAGNPHLPADIVDVGNSGTSMNFLMGVASQVDGASILTGDHQIRHRPVRPLLNALRTLGAEATSAPQTGCPPVIIRGKIGGGYVEVKGKISQYLSALLTCCPLSAEDTEIKAIDLGEKPYVQMTLSWLDKQGIRYQGSDDLERFQIEGNQTYRAFQDTIPGDFSSATFFICAAAIPGCELTLTGLDFDDTQGDKGVVDLLRYMGADVELSTNTLSIRGTELEGRELDLNDMPDALPALAVVGCLANGVTTLRNVAHARLKETDRIATMRRELTTLGADIEELDDGLIIRHSKLSGATVDSCHDHRIAMSLSIAGLVATGRTHILNAGAVNVTFPQFPNLLRQLGATIEIVRSYAA